VANKLERGKLRLDDCCVVNLKHARSPLVIFASSGDNITPPQQALNWIPVMYATTEDLKQAGQRIVYLLNEHVGHLGIFVSADVARREFGPEARCTDVANICDFDRVQLPSRSRPRRPAAPPRRGTISPGRGVLVARGTIPRARASSR
jgi:hypothetical protein